MATLKCILKLIFKLQQHKLLTFIMAQRPYKSNLYSSYVIIIILLFNLHIQSIICNIFDVDTLLSCYLTASPPFHTFNNGGLDIIIIIILF